MSSLTFDLMAFKAFVDSKPRGEGYDPGNSQTCALAQFGFEGLTHSSTKSCGVPEPVYSAAVHLRSDREATFGALSDRLAKVKELIA